MTKYYKLVILDIMKSKNYFVYILTNKYNNVFYVGVTNNLARRIQEHKNKIFKKSFSSRYNLTKLVWYDHTNSIETAIDFEKKIKGKKRNYKIDLINKKNPEWKDLSYTLND